MMRVSKTPRETGRRTLPEALLVEIIARLPLKSIARFKSVCKTLKSVIESTYFRSFFVSLHRNSFLSWSLMLIPGYIHSITEAIGFTKCETWGLSKSLVSYFLPFQLYPNLSTSDYQYVCSSNGLILISFYREHPEDNYKYFVGNPVLQQWVKIPSPPNPAYWFIGLVTRVENGVVSSFKVIMNCRTDEPRDKGMYVRKVCIYSSETGLWNFKRLLSSHPLDDYYSLHAPVNIDEMLYMWEKDMDPNEPKVLVAHDFYAPETECRVIPLPVPYNENVKRCLTTSRGNVICIDILHRKLKIWRLMNINSLEDELC